MAYLCESVNLNGSPSSLMASSSSSSRPRTWRYRVFTSFHGPDVRKTFLSHLRKQFNNNGISMFNDQGIERGKTIGPELTQAIRESRISIVVLSKNYASSGWCLDELLEILKCKIDIGQTVLTVFYGVDPFDVRKQTGDFGKAFKETCACKTKYKKERWSQALEYVGNIAGEHLRNWDTESEMIEKIARDVSDKLNIAISSDFEDMVGIEAHLEKMQSLLHLDDDHEGGAMIVGICGPAGIGKTTIARALHCRLASSFQRTCFMENLRGSCNSGFDMYGLKLRLQELLLSKILNQKDMRICHLGAIRDWLCDQKVLIILDDVDDKQQLEALAKDTKWFGHGSRIIVTTEDQELLEQHGINVYHVDFPTKEDACKIFCSYAFTRRSSAPYGFQQLAERATELCGNLPLGLYIIGSNLHRKKEDDWESILQGLETSNIRKIDALLRVGYDSLHENDQFLFCLIALFLNYKNDGYVEAMLADMKLNVRLGMKNLANKSLIQLSSKGEVVMHKLLQQVGIQAIKNHEHRKRKILIDNDEILDVLENNSGSGSLMGIGFDISTIKDCIEISPKALKRLHNLQFLWIYNTRWDSNVRVHLPEDMDFPPRLKLLQWEEYPGKCLPHTFMPEHLVELNLSHSKLKHLWKGTQPLGNLKKLNLKASSNLEELPDLANATNLERLDVSKCQNLVEIHSSVGNLHKLERLEIELCRNLQVVPTLINLTSLDEITLWGCYQLKKLPDIPPTVTLLGIVDTMLEECSASIRLWSRLVDLIIFGSDVPNQVIAQSYWEKMVAERSGGDIERIPDCIKDLHGLELFGIIGCPKLVSLPELPRSLTRLAVVNCESLETLVPFPCDSQIKFLYFNNCIKLGEEARRIIIQQSWRAFLPGRDIPAEFNHRAIGNSLTISSNACGFKICVIVSPKSEMDRGTNKKLMCRISNNGCPTENYSLRISWSFPSEHLVIFYSENILRKEFSETLFEFSCSSQDHEIIECGVRIFRDFYDYGFFAKRQLVQQMLEDYGGTLSNESLAAAIAEIRVDLRDSPEYDAVIEKMIDDYYWRLTMEKLLEVHDGSPSSIAAIEK